jgi:hypothetical protein
MAIAALDANSVAQKDVRDMLSAFEPPALAKTVRNNRIQAWLLMAPFCEIREFAKIVRIVRALQIKQLQFDIVRAMVTRPVGNKFEPVMENVRYIARLCIRNNFPMHLHYAMGGSKGFKLPARGSWLQSSALLRTAAQEVSLTRGVLRVAHLHGHLHSPFTVISVAKRLVSDDDHEALAALGALGVRLHPCRCSVEDALYRDRTKKEAFRHKIRTAMVNHLAASKRAAKAVRDAKETMTRAEKDKAECDATISSYDETHAANMALEKARKSYRQAETVMQRLPAPNVGRWNATRDAIVALERARREHDHARTMRTLLLLRACQANHRMVAQAELQDYTRRMQPTIASWTTHMSHHERRVNAFESIVTKGDPVLYVAAKSGSVATLNALVGAEGCCKCLRRRCLDLARGVVRDAEAKWAVLVRAGVCDLIVRGEEVKQHEWHAKNGENVVDIILQCQIDNLRALRACGMRVNRLEHLVSAMCRNDMTFANEIMARHPNIRITPRSVRTHATTAMAFARCVEAMHRQMVEHKWTIKMLSIIENPTKLAILVLLDSKRAKSALTTHGDMFERDEASVRAAVVLSACRTNSLAFRKRKWAPLTFEGMPIAVARHGSLNDSDDVVRFAHVVACTTAGNTRRSLFRKPATWVENLARDAEALVQRFATPGTIPAIKSAVYSATIAAHAKAEAAKAEKKAKEAKAH